MFYVIIFFECSQKSDLVPVFVTVYGKVPTQEVPSQKGSHPQSCRGGKVPTLFF